MSGPYTSPVSRNSTSTDRLNGALASLGLKAPCVVATNANITLSAPQTVNSVAVVASDRVLVKDQTDATENGIYVVESGDWTRAPDFDGNRDVVQGTLCVVHNALGNVWYQLTTPNPITIATTSLAFALVESPANSAITIGNLLNPRTAAEEAAGIDAYDAGNTIGDIMFPKYLPGDIRRYGALLTTTDNIAALYAAVNQHSWGGSSMYVPSAAGRFRFASTLHVYFHTTLNPNYNNDGDPPATSTQGNIRITGDIRPRYNEWREGVYRGSILEYTGSSGYAIQMGNETNGTARNMRFEDVGICATATSDYVVKFGGTSQNSGASDCSIYQAGTGGGVFVDESWGIEFHDTRIVNSHASNLGIGLYAKQTTAGMNGAGLYIHDHLTCKGFEIGCQYGAKNTAGGTDTLFQTVSFYDCEFGGNGQHNSEVGLILADKCDTVTVDNPYFENCYTNLMQVQSSVATLYIRGGNLAGRYCSGPWIVIGVNGGNTWQNRVRAVNIWGAHFSNSRDSQVIIEYNKGSDSHSLTVQQCMVGLDGGHTGAGSKFLDVKGDGAGIVFDRIGFANSLIPMVEYTLTTGVLDRYVGMSQLAAEAGDIMNGGIWLNKLGAYTNTDNGGDVDIAMPFVKLDSTGGAVTVHVQDGIFNGQIVWFYSASHSATSRVDFETDSTADPSIGTTGRTFSGGDQSFAAVYFSNKWNLLMNNGSGTY